MDSNEVLFMIVWWGYFNSLFEDYKKTWVCLFIAFETTRIGVTLDWEYCHRKTSPLISYVGYVKSHFFQLNCLNSGIHENAN